MINYTESSNARRRLAALDALTPTSGQPSLATLGTVTADIPDTALSIGTGSVTTNVTLLVSWVPIAGASSVIIDIPSTVFISGVATSITALSYLHSTSNQSGTGKIDNAIGGGSFMPVTNAGTYAMNIFTNVPIRIKVANLGSVTLTARVSSPSVSPAYVSRTLLVRPSAALIYPSSN